MKIRLMLAKLQKISFTFFCIFASSMQHVYCSFTLMIVCMFLMDLKLRYSFTLIILYVVKDLKLRSSFTLIILYVLMDLKLRYSFTLIILYVVKDLKLRYSFTLIILYVFNGFKIEIQLYTENYPHAFLKKRRGYCNRLRPSVRLSVCPSVRPSVTLSPPKPLDEIQPNLVCVLLT